MVIRTRIMRSRLPLTITSLVITAIALAIELALRYATDPTIHPYHDNDDMPLGRLGVMVVMFTAFPAGALVLVVGILTVCLHRRWWPAWVAAILSIVPLAAMYTGNVLLF